MNDHIRKTRDRNERKKRNQPNGVDKAVAAYVAAQADTKAFESMAKKRPLPMPVKEQEEKPDKDRTPLPIPVKVHRVSNKSE